MRGYLSPFFLWGGELASIGAQRATTGAYWVGVAKSRMAGAIGEAKTKP